MGTILLIILILLLIGALPAWPYSTGWGYWPSGGLGLILLIVIILALTGHVLGVARSADPASGGIRKDVRSEASSALEQITSTKSTRSSTVFRCSQALMRHCFEVLHIRFRS